MKTFLHLKELLNTLHREERLISELFSRRNLMFKYEYALELVDYKEDKILRLLEHEILRKNEDYIEIEDLYLEFFEKILQVNEEVTISYINENITTIKENIEYYLNENKETLKYNYLKVIKNIFKKIGSTTLRNVIDLRRNVENTFKNEPNYKNKKLKLENLDRKRKDIILLIQQIEKLLEDEKAFLKIANDDDLDKIIIALREKLNDSGHNLIEIEKQIIEYLNQIKYQNELTEKLRKIKYLKDQFTLKTDTNLHFILQSENLLNFEPNPIYSVKLSLDYLSTSDEAFEIIKKVANKNSNKLKNNIKSSLAAPIEQEYLENAVEEEILIDLEKVKNNFLATSNNLFDFVMRYKFDKEISFNEKVTLYCQLVSRYEHLFEIKDKYEMYNNVEYTMIYPK